MGIDDIIANEPRYAGAYEDAKLRRQHQRRLDERTEQGRVAVATTDGGTTQQRGTELSVGGMEMRLSETETLILALLFVNTAMTAGLLFAVLMR
jgi:hypothetical protein